MPDPVGGDLRDLLNGMIVGLVEGLTELIPVSSTGHLIIVADALDFHGPVPTSNATGLLNLIRHEIDAAAMEQRCWL